MNDNYNNLLTFNFGKRVYVVLKNNERIIYFESVNGQFVPSITSFNLYDNEGKSLTLVNQHFFMSELVNRINIACKKGFLVTDKEIIDYLNSVKDKAINDARLKQLFKGSLMGEINEINFESNKREITAYLDSFKFDNFKKFNNVSVFSGSIEKNTVSADELNPKTLTGGVTVGDIVKEGLVNNVEVINDSTFNLNDVTNNEQELKKINEAPNINNNFDFSSSIFDNSNNDFNLSKEKEPIDNNIETTHEVKNDNASVQNLMNQDLQNNDTSIYDNMTSTDYSQNIALDNANNSYEKIDESAINNFSQENNIVTNEVINNQNIQPLDIFTPNVLDDNIIVEPSNNTQINNVSYEQNINTSNIENINDVNQNYNGLDTANLQNNDTNNTMNFETTISQNNISSTSENSNISYIDSVKNRISNDIAPTNTSDSNNINKEYGSDMISNTIIQDKSDFEIYDEDIEQEVNIPKEEPTEKPKKKGNVGIIIFIIILILILGAFGYYLYNFIF